MFKNNKIIFMLLVVMVLVAVTASPVMASGSDILYLSLPSGTWTYDGADWTSLTSSVAQALAVDGGTLYLSLPSGTWTYDGADWTSLTSSVAQALAVDGGTLYLSLPSGTWTYDGADWTNLTSSTAQALAVDSGVLYASLPSGTWVYSSGIWAGSALTSSVAQALAIDGGALYASLPSGIWTYSAGSWAGSALTTSSAQALAAVGDVLYASLPSGTWAYASGSWAGSALTSSVAQALAVTAGSNEITLNVEGDESGSIIRDFIALPGGVVAGDRDVNRVCRGYISFDISALSGARIQKVELRMTNPNVIGDPSFMNATLITKPKGLWIGALTWGDRRLMVSDYDLPIRVSFGNHLNYHNDIIRTSEIGGATPTLATDLQGRIDNGDPRYQLRLRFDNEITNNNNMDDAVRFEQENITLTIWYN